MDFQKDPKKSGFIRTDLPAHAARLNTTFEVEPLPLPQGELPSMSLSNTLPPPPDWAIQEALGLPDVHVTWLAGDGSDRCYYRIKSSASFQSFVLMQLSGDDAQQLKEDGYEWVKIGRLLHDHGIYAPQTIAPMPNFAALIIEDYGDVMLETHSLKALAHHQREPVLNLYRKSFEILGRFLQITEAGHSHWQERSFDAQRLEWELHFFREQFIEGVLSWQFSSKELAAFSEDAKLLALTLAQGSRFFVHRDFHSRNVMVKDSDLAVIDFQDARLGPATYDLVSLCFDSYIPLIKAERQMLVREGISALQRYVPSLSIEQLENEWKPMLLQRQLKALGSFGFLTRKKLRGNYLRYVKPALETLDIDSIKDARWSFISNQMIQEIVGRWEAREPHP